ncbi:hypothetical protein, partial [Salinactinospora qingdaonensis]|uniref:hypothetical protein n=1 Tax=Salinactinospora qingdaonensis TaxID=702744 RepID=UPI0031F073A1
MARLGPCSAVTPTHVRATISETRKEIALAPSPEDDRPTVPLNEDENRVFDAIVAAETRLNHRIGLSNLVAGLSPHYLLEQSRNGTPGLWSRYDCVPLSPMIRGVVSPGTRGAARPL